MALVLAVSGLPWFRLYDETLDDPKVQRLPDDLFRHWINLLCLANRGNPRGRLPADMADVAFALRLSSEEQAWEVMVELTRRDLLVFDEAGQSRPHNWDKRQFKSDNVSDRVAAHRARNVSGNVTEPLPETLPEQNRADPDSEQSREVGDAPTALDRPKYSTVFETFWREWWSGVTKGHGGKVPAYAAWKRLKLDRREAEPIREEIAAGLARWKASAYWQQEGGRFVMRAERWLRERAWDDEPPEVLAQPRASPPGSAAAARLTESDRMRESLDFFKRKAGLTVNGTEEPDGRTGDESDRHDAAIDVAFEPADSGPRGDAGRLAPRAG